MAKKKDTLKDERSNAEAEVRRAIGANIGAIRKRLNYSAKTVSEHLRVTRVAVTQMETGRNNINAVTLWELAALFDCSVADFFPEVPDGYAITNVDLKRVAQVDHDAADWAKKIFVKK